MVLVSICERASPARPAPPPTSGRGTGRRMLFIPHWRLLCFGKRVKELSSVSTWGPSLAHPPNLLLLLGRHRRILRPPLHNEEPLGCLPYMSLSHFHVLLMMSLNLSVKSILLAQNHFSRKNILDIRMERKFVIRISIISLVSIYQKSLNPRSQCKIEQLISILMLKMCVSILHVNVDQNYLKKKKKI